MLYAEAAAARRRFLKYVALTGNASQACRLAGSSRSGIEKRRLIDPVFATDYLAAMAVAQAARLRVAATYDAEIGTWRVLNPYERMERPNLPSQAALARAIRPPAALLVYVPGRQKAPLESPYADFDQAALKAYWALAMTPYPEATADCARETGELGDARFLTRWAAARIAAWYVMSDAPFAKLDLTRVMGGKGSPIRTLFNRAISAQLDRRAARSLAGIAPDRVMEILRADIGNAALAP